MIPSASPQRASSGPLDETDGSGEQLRLAIESIPGLVWTALPDGYIDFLNHQWLDYTGLSLAQACGWGWQVAVHPGDLPGLVTYWRSVLASGQPGETEARLRRFDGEYRWFSFRGVPLHDDRGRLVKWYGQTTDIHDRKCAEALLAGENRILEMIARGNERALILDALCRLVEELNSGSLCAVLALDPISRKLSHLAAPSLPKTYTQAVDGRTIGPASGPCGVAAHRGEQRIVTDVLADPLPEDYRKLSRDNGLRSCWSTPILSQERKVLGVFTIHSPEPRRPSPTQLSVIEQFTHLASIAMERAQAEQALRRSEAYLTEAQRLSQTGSFYWNVKSGEIVWSPETHRIFGIDPALAPTLDLARQRVHPDDLPNSDRVVQRAVAEGKDLTLEHRLRMPDGSIKYLQVVAHAVRCGPDDALEYLGAVRDVTERKLSEDALHRARDELAHVARVTTLGQLTASIAHELNQPLAGIVTNANACVRLLADTPPKISLAMGTAKRSIRDATRAAEVIARLRQLFGKQSPAREPFDLNDAVREVVALTRGELQRGRAVLRLELVPGFPLVAGNRVQIQQVALNLIMNALDAMSGIEDRVREMVIASTVQPDEVHVVIQDSGSGFESKDKERLFEPFYSTKSGGMGMGLSISRSIVEDHGGHLWAALNDGRGASFHFTLPREAASVAS